MKRSAIYVSMDTVIIIPAYNEEATIAQVIKDVQKSMDADIVVVNDGSRDHTSAITHELGVKVIDLQENQGIGVAMRTGYQYAYAQNYQFAIQVDADGQHDINRLQDILDLIKNKQCDMAVGSRYVIKTNYHSTFLRRLGIRYFSILLYVLHKKWIKDTTSGFRAVNQKVINVFMKQYPDDYPEVPMLSYLLKHDFSVCEIPVEMKQRQGGKSSINFTDSIVYMIKTTAVCLKQYFTL